MGEKLFTQKRHCPHCEDEAPATVVREARDYFPMPADAFSSRKTPQPFHPRYLRCSTCALVYASPSFPAEKTARAYAAAPIDNSDLGVFAASDYWALLKDTALAHLRIARHAALEIGCGNGALLDALLALGFQQVTGCDPSASLDIHGEQSDKRIIKTCFEETDFGLESFSLITAFQVLEHVPEPAEFLERVWALLKPGGIFVSVFHDERGIGHRFLQARSPLYDVQHYQLFSKASARRLLEKKGFRVTYLKPFLNSYPVSYWMRLVSLSPPQKRWAQYPLRLPAGNLAVVATKT